MENAAVARDEFYWSDLKEPHLSRRKNIMSEHPEVRSLFGIDRSILPITSFWIILQLTIAYFVPAHAGWAILMALVFGSIISHVLFLAIHEITHNLAFKKEAYNNILAIAANFPLVIPYAMAFKRYHHLHHWSQGDVEDDVDIPSEAEAKIFKGRIGKFIWLINQLLFYAFRPVFIRPLKMDKWQVINLLAQLAFIIPFTMWVGGYGLLYLGLSMFFAGGLNPLAGHFISEHYVFKEGQETYSYYGFWNKITFNVGYHNEHHDFPSIPGSKLPELKSIASEYYDDLYAHKSWSKVLWDFVMRKDVSLYSRIKRKA